MARFGRYLKLRGNRFYFQMAVPEDCRGPYGGPTIETSLKTSDRAVAQAMALQLAGKHKAEFAALRGKTVSHPSEIFRSTAGRVRKEIEHYRRTIADPNDAEQRVELIYDLELEGALQEAGKGDVSELRDEDLPPERLARLTAIRSVLDGNGDIPPEYRTPFSDLARAYLQDRQRDGSTTRLTAQTIAQMEAVYRLYRDHSADAPLGMSTVKGAAKFFDKLKRLDADWGRSPRTKTRTLEQLLDLSAAKENRRGLSDRTLFRYAIALDQLWEWAKRRGEVDGDSPFKGQAAKGDSNRTANAPWSDAAIVSYFSASPDRSTDGKPDPFYWLPRIALLSGMRLEEICALEASDIIEPEGVKCFQIRRAKTSAGERVVPIHDALLPLLKCIPKRGFLFPDLVPGGVDKKRSAQIGKRLGRKFKQVGGSTFHAFRKNVTGTFERARIAESEAAQILGHGKKGITYGVYSPYGITIAQRKGLIDLLSLPPAA